MDEYAELMEAGHEFPALVAYHDGKKYWLSEGFTRHAAALRAGLKDFACVVRSGTRRDAARNALHSNAEHGFRRTNADKRHAVLKCLNDDEWKHYPDRQVARLCAVTQQFVSKVRSEIEDNDSQEDDCQTSGGTTVVPPDVSETSVESKKADAEPSANGAAHRDPDPAPDPDLPEYPNADAAQDQRSALHKLARALDDARAEVERLGRAPLGHCLHFQSVVAQLTSARGTVWQGRPTHPCPYCAGTEADCEVCKETRWVKKATFEQAPPEKRAAVAGEGFDA